MTAPGWDFAAELARFGPHFAGRVGLADARRYCAGVTRRHAENFTVAALFLPRRLVPHVHAVYAYCRWSDDLADETGGRAPELLAWWRGELLAALAGEARHPVLAAIADTARRFAIPPTPFLDLLDAFEQDQRQREYATFAELVGYCRRSANPVGHLVLYLWGVHTPGNARLADETCTGLQLANFWQDVGRDHAIGRCYLPREDCDRFGYAEADWRACRETPAFKQLLAFQVERTRGFFDRGDALLPRLPPLARLSVSLFGLGGRAVLRAIERQGYAVWTRRPTVSGRAKAGLMLKALRRLAG